MGSYSFALRGVVVWEAGKEMRKGLKIQENRILEGMQPFDKY